MLSRIYQGTVALAKSLLPLPRSIDFINYQGNHLANTHIELQAPNTPPRTKKTLMCLPQNTLRHIFFAALPPKDDELEHAITKGEKMPRYHATSCSSIPALLFVNKAIHEITRGLWLNVGFTHIYLNSWNEIPTGLLSQCDNIRFLALTVDIRNGRHGTEEGKLRPTVFCKKLRDLLGRMKNVRMLVLRVWHGKNAIQGVSRLVLNSFQGFRVEVGVQCVSTVNVEDLDGEVLGVGLSSALEPWYLRRLLGAMLDRDPETLPRFYCGRKKKTRRLLMSIAAAARDPAQDVVVPAFTSRGVPVDCGGKGDQHPGMHADDMSGLRREGLELRKR